MPYTLYLSRWGVLFSFSFSNALNAFLWISFSAIFAQCQALWGVSSLAVTWLSLVFLLLYLPGSIIFSVVIERWGLRAGILLGTALNCLGAVLRYLGALSRTPGGFALTMIGQCIASVAQPLFTNSPARVSADWFAHKEREAATSIAALSNAVGNALGSVLPPIFVNTADDLPMFLLGQAGVSVALLLLAVALVRRDRPPTPPSGAAELRAAAAVAVPLETSSSAPLIEPEGAELNPAAPANTLMGALRQVATDYKALLSDRNFCFLAAGFGFGLGLFNAFLTLLAQIIKPCGYSDDVAGNAGAALLGSGLLAAIVFGAVLEKTKAYVSILRVGIIMSLASMLFFLSSLRSNATIALYASSAILGSFLIPLLPTSLEAAAETTYPIPEDTSACLLLVMGNYVGFVLILALQPLLNLSFVADCSTLLTPTAAIICAFMLIAAACIAIFKANYKRQQAEGRGRISDTDTAPLM
jgi:MFS transporter, FLVCR family, feline leukemia virus subgroup C receptor-related protein